MAVREPILAGKLASTIAIIANGLQDSSDFLLKRLKEFKLIFLVDGAANDFYQLEKTHAIVQPSAIIGDLDSIEPHILNHYKNKNIPIIQLDRAKDKNDLEFALEYVLTNYQQQSISIFGGFGKRIDHTLANLFILTTIDSPIFFEAEHEVAFLIRNETQALVVNKGQTISLIPFFGPCELTTSGLKWELNHKLLNFAGLSNIAMQENCLITVHNGRLICIINDFIDKEMLLL